MHKKNISVLRGLSMGFSNCGKEDKTMQVQYDKFEQLASDAELAVAILGNPETSDFELIDLAPGPLTHDRNSLHERRMVFIGVMGIVRGFPRFALDTPLDAATTTALAQAFVRHVEVTAARELETAWLGRLYQLPDTRN
jgi:hypothetical protein